MKKLLFTFAAAVLMLSMAFMTACGVREAPGTFYTLEEAYNNGWLTEADLEQIAEYHNIRKDYPEALKNSVETAIKATAVYDMRRNEDIRAKKEDVTIIEYCGTYNDCVAVRFSDSHHNYAATEESDTIAGVFFYYGDGNKIKIWRKG